MMEHRRQQQQQQRFLLRWHRHATTIADQLPHMFDEGLFTDVTLSVNGEHLRAHRLILASCSPYFLRLFQEADRTSVDHPFVILLNAHVDDIKAILAFMYKGECCVYKERIPELLTTARNLKVSGLSDMELNDCTENIRTFTCGRIETLITNQDVQDNANNTHENVINDAETVSQPSPPPPQKLPNNRDVPETCKCFVCGKYLSNQYNLRVHMETHQETYHACSSCPHVSRSRDALRKHMSYRHPDKYNTRKQKKIGFI